MSDLLQPIPTCDAPLETAPDLQELLDRLNLTQIRFFIARQDCDMDKDAAAAIGITASAVKSWPPAIKETIRQALVLAARDGVVTALHLRRKTLAKAMAVKVRGLDSADERIRQGTSTEIIEWELGKALQKSQINMRAEVVQVAEEIVDARSQDTTLPGSGQVPPE
jgi:hypothetical protein